MLAVIPAWSFLTYAYRTVKSPMMQTARGNVKLLTWEAGSDAVIRRIMDLPVADTVFFYPYNPLLPFLTARIHPARFDVLVPNYTTPAQFYETCRSVLRSTSWVVIDRDFIA